MQKYKLLAHTADIRLNVQAKTLQELFAVALEGMASIMKSESTTWKSCDCEKEITVSSLDVTTLLIDFLSDVLTLSTIHKAVFTCVVFEQFTERSLKAIVKGVQVQGFDEDIKAVTYHDAQVEQDDGGMYTVTITFDI